MLTIPLLNNHSPLAGEEAVTLFEQRLLDYLDVLVPGRNPVDVVYEIAQVEAGYMEKSKVVSFKTFH